MEKIIAVSVGHFGPRALVRAVLQHSHIVTGNPGSGAPNITVYQVLVAGHELRATWDDDARHDTAATIGADHPLAEAVRLIAAAQKACQMIISCQRMAPCGYTAQEWADIQYDCQAAWSAARRAVKEDPIAESIAAW